MTNIHDPQALARTIADATAIDEAKVRPIVSSIIGAAESIPVSYTRIESRQGQPNDADLVRALVQVAEVAQILERATPAMLVVSETAQSDALTKVVKAATSPSTDAVRIVRSLLRIVEPSS